MDHPANPVRLAGSGHLPGMTVGISSQLRIHKTAFLNPMAWMTVVAIVFASLIRQTDLFQLQLSSNLFISVQMLTLFLLGLWACLRLIVFHKPRSFPFPLLVAGPIFLIYAVAADAYRGSGTGGLLFIDALQATLPIFVAVGLLHAMKADQADRLLDTLRWTIAVICIIYMVIAFIAVSSDFGDLVATRYAYAERLPFQRLSGPLGGATSLGIILLPCLAFTLDELRAKPERRLLNLGLAGIYITSILWTGSQLHIALLVIFVASFFSFRWSVFMIIAGLLVLSYLNLDSSLAALIPAKWADRGFTDPGRTLALETSLRAWLSDVGSFFFGVGSDRMNILSDTILRVARGDLFFNEWMTDFGPMPYGPHSILWWSLSSYGLFGAVFRCAFLMYLPFAILRLKVQDRRRHEAVSYPTAVILSAAGFFFDDGHIVYPYLMTIWFIFLLLLIRRQRASSIHRGPR